MTGVPYSARHEHLRAERHDAIVTVRIEREAALGALSRGILETMLAIERDLRSDQSVRVVVLTGTGKGFIAGADIGEYHGVSQAEFDAYQRLGRSVFDGWESLPQYTIAAVNGWALGGGFELALCADEIFATARAKFGLPEVKLGLLPGGGGSQRLAHALGSRFTKRLIATGEFVRADELHRRGLLSGVHEDQEQLLQAVMEHAALIAGNAPLAVRRAKRVVDDGLGMPLADALGHEQQVLSELYGSVDAKEGIDAFVSKRDPAFVGR